MLALGVMSFALLSLLGLLPIGLTVARKSIEQTACSHIVQGISGDLLALSHDTLPDYLAQPRYYDNNGTLLSSEDDAVFVAALDSAGPSYPGSDDLTDLGDQFKRVIITVSRMPQPENKSHIFRTALALAELHP